MVVKVKEKNLKRLDMLKLKINLKNIERYHNRFLSNKKKSYNFTTSSV